jgi:phosphotriesterase-related protein
VRSYAATREQNIDRVVKLLERGYEDQLMLSNGSVAFTDCLPSTFVGEYEPYTQLQLDIIPALKQRGASENQIEKMTVLNASRAFESLGRGGY